MAFWKPGTVAPGSSIDREAEVGAGRSDGAGAGAITGHVDGTLSITDKRARLPIAKQRDALLYLLERHPVVVLQSPTGTGKSTQLPQYLMEAGWATGGKLIGVTQPRRVAAVSVAQRVAEESGSLLGEEVGYCIRFEAKAGPATKILYLTDGMLFREILLDPLLSRYSIVMVDEAHERSQYTDLLLSALKRIRRVRPELRIVISSATIDAQDFVDYFNRQPPIGKAPPPMSSTSRGEDGQPPTKRSRWDKTEREPAPKLDDAVMVRLEGKTYPVEISYTREAVEDVVEAAVSAVFDIHTKLPPGDILIFMTGRDDITRCLQAVADNARRLPEGAQEILPLPLHAGLSAEEQMSVFDPAPRRTRKVICATNVAEASVTIDGIKYVIDSGFVKLKSFNPYTGMEALVTAPCSISSLDQRAGRAGRTSLGYCFRLFPQSALADLDKSTPPEITRSDISQLVLQLKSLGVPNVLRYDYVTAPSAEMLERALEFLYCLKAIDDQGQLTRPLGMRMAEMPTEPMMSKILLDSHNFGCSEEILSIAAMTCVQNVFILSGKSDITGELERRKFTSEEGDHLTLLNVYEAFVNKGKKSAKFCQQHRLNFKALSRAVSIHNQLLKYLKRWSIPLVSSDGDGDAIRRCLVSGFFRNAAEVQPDGTYRSVRERATLHAHPDSVLFTRHPPSKIVIFHEVIETTKRFMRDITAVEKEWLSELAPHYYSLKR